MYIWNIKGLVQALKKGSLSSKSQKQYKAIGISLFALALLADPILMMTESFNRLDIIDMISYLVINLVGIYIAYILNKRGDGKEFGFRYFSLYLPITLRFFVLFLIITIVGYLVLPIFYPSILLDETNWFDLFTSVGTEVYFNILMVKYIKKVNE
ncbi:hypothetical protein V7148_23280 [Gottfriedia acidiceleris]|uniref:hypothetical protein n=1 Tax=Bacillaceae TaxID=186817 RepID=UPI000BEC66BB|nr:MULTISPECIES: hypothetical protein [unclassified Bacillus (in: firmicutes)]PEC50308.1 hypothetical protein CON00_06790 [Bacillus sp. AFS096315]PFH80323.1 hypothetical protein COI44_23715 [Bacillus sp. AFS088145]PFM74942.1 hypothetical protein COJ46_22690 [Bacillus sp. AFS077874]